jgi:hypothetical protein
MQEIKKGYVVWFYNGPITIQAKVIQVNKKNLRVQDLKSGQIITLPRVKVASVISMQES